MSSSIPSHYQLHLPTHHLSKLRLKTSLNSLQTSRSVRSLTSTQLPVDPRWWQRRPLLRDAYFTTLQKGSQYVAIFCFIHSCIQTLFAMFNVYCLLSASPGSSHFRQLGISFIFVYTGNQIVRWFLVLTSVILLPLSIGLAFTSLMLLKALQKEQERHFRPFLCCLVAYIVGRFLALVYEGLVNDPIYFYYRLSMALWSFVLVGDVYALLVVYSNYQELCDLTRLEDFAKEKARSLSIGRSMQDTLNRRSSSSCYSVSARQSQTPQAQSPQSPQTIQSSQTPTGQSLTTQPTRSGSSLSSNTRASLADFSTVSVSSVEAARKQHLQQLYLQQQEYYAEIRRQREQERHQHDHLSDSESPHILHRPIGREQQLSVANLPPIQRQGTPLL